MSTTHVTFTVYTDEILVERWEGLSDKVGAEVGRFGRGKPITIGDTFFCTNVHLPNIWGKTLQIEIDENNQYRLEFEQPGSCSASGAIVSTGFRVILD